VVDVWEELGKAVGRALKPLADIGRMVWRSLGDAAGDLAEGFMKGAEGVGRVVEPIITPQMSRIMSESAAALGPGTPKEDIEKAAKELAEALIKAMQEKVPKKGKSPPALKDLQTSVALIVAAAFGLYGGTTAISMALDAVHPIKDLGFKAAAMDILHSFSVQDVISPMVHAPLWSGVIAPLRLRMNQLYPYEVPGSMDLVRLRVEGLLEEGKYTEAMSFHGLDADWSGLLRHQAERVPAFPELREMLWRKAKDEPALRGALVKMGIRSDFLDAYVELCKPRVGAGDLVTMSVREAFEVRPGDEEMRDRFVTEMAKWGYDRETCLWHWRSHWRLVAIEQVFDMYHRGIKMPMSVEEFLKWADYSPEWRGPLEKLSWRLPGRIDARWMFRWGEVNVDGLQDLLVKDGLDPEWAPSVAVATARNQFLTEINKLRDNSKSDFVKGYLLEPGLRANLEALGYPPTWVEFHVLDAVADRDRAMKDDAVAVLSDAYLKDELTEDGLLKGLSDYIVSPERVTMELDRLYLKKYKRLRVA